MGKDKSEESVMMILHQLMHLSEYLVVQGLERLDLNPGQAGILFWLGREGELSQRQLARKVGITPPSVTTAIRKLEGKAMIEKEADPHDQRVFKIRLSKKGKASLEQLKEEIQRLEEVLYQGISAEEKLLLRRILLDMRNNLMEVRNLKGMNACSIMAQARLNKKLGQAEGKEDAQA
nr:MarR family transcriptional regulator [uncultured Merdimonas sp.]